VGEQQLRSIVAERRRVPEGHVGIGDRRQTLRVERIANVEQQPVAGARTTRIADRRIRRDVVTAALSNAVVAISTTTTTTTSRRRRSASGRRACGTRGGRTSTTSTATTTTATATTT